MEKTLLKKQKLSALKLIKVGGQYVYPNRGKESEFLCKAEGANHLLSLGAARELSVEDAETPANHTLETLIKGLKVEQLKSGLDELQIGYESGAKKGELQQALLTAAEANPIQWTEIAESLAR